MAISNQATDDIDHEVGGAAMPGMREHVTFADESERVEDMAIECPISP
jgi:hypothetical protein